MSISRESRNCRLPPADVLAHRLDDTRHAFAEFAYTVAHDLNAPLRCIASFSQLLEEKCGDGLDEKTHHYIDVIAHNSRKAQARLAGLLQYSRLDTVPLSPARVDARQAAEHALKALRDEVEVREALLRLQPLPTLTADGERLELLWYCLFSNALKFGGTRPEIEVSAQRGHEAWLFCVRDGGIGIAPKHQESIFEVFHRLHGDDEYPGIGIGLALARRIAELHGGTIWVESRPGKGAAFYFSIPDLLPAE